MTNVGADTTWVLGVVAAITEGYLEKGARGIRERKNFTDARSESYILIPGKLIVDLKGATSREMAIYFVVPKATRIRYAVDGISVATTSVDQSLLVRDGRAINQPLRGFSQLTNSLTQPVVPATAPIQLPNGDLLVAKEALREHLRSGSVPASAVVTPAVGNAKHATVVASIDSTGTVMSILKTGGNPGIVGLASAFVQDWKFTPFQQNGQPIGVQAMFVFFADKNGTISVAW